MKKRLSLLMTAFVTLSIITGNPIEVKAMSQKKAESYLDQINQSATNQKIAQKIARDIFIRKILNRVHRDERGIIWGMHRGCNLARSGASYHQAFNSAYDDIPFGYHKNENKDKDHHYCQFVIKKTTNKNGKKQDLYETCTYYKEGLHSGSYISAVQQDQYWFMSPYGIATYIKEAAKSKAIKSSFFHLSLSEKYKKYNFLSSPEEDMALISFLYSKERTKIDVLEFEHKINNGHFNIEPYKTDSGKIRFHFVIPPNILYNDSNIFLIKVVKVVSGEHIVRTTKIKSERLLYLAQMWVMVANNLATLIETHSLGLSLANLTVSRIEYQKSAEGHLAHRMIFVINHTGVIQDKDKGPDQMEEKKNEHAVLFF